MKLQKKPPKNLTGMDYNMFEVIKKMITNPKSSRRAGRIAIQKSDGNIEWFGWNRVYHVYNSLQDYRQLTTADLIKIVWY